MNRSHLPLVVVLAIAVVAAAVAVVLRRRGHENPAVTVRAATPVAIPASTAAARELGAALHEEKRWVEAERVLRDVAGRSDAVAQDFVNVACVLVRRGLALGADQTDQLPPILHEIDRLCDEAMRRDGKLASARYVRAAALDHWGSPPEPDRVRALLEPEVELAPEDWFGRAHLGQAFEALDQPELALPHYEKVAAAGQEFAGEAYRVSIYRLSRILLHRRQGDDVARGKKLLAEHTRIEQEEERLGQSKSSEQVTLEFMVGLLGKVSVAPLRPEISPVAGRKLPVAWEPEIHLLADAGALTSIDVGDVDGDRIADVVAVGKRGVWIALQRADRNFVEARLASGEFDRVVVAELDFREDRDSGVKHRARGSLLAFGKSGARLFFAQEPGWFSDDREVLPPLPDLKDVQPVDFDHDGMLDLLLATADGTRLLRNRGPELDESQKVVVGPLRFDEATGSASLAGVHADWVAIEDFDHDQDVDLLLGGASVPTLLFSNLRKGLFERFGPERSGLPGSLPAKPLLADFDHDGIADLLTTGAAASFSRGKGDGTFEPPRKWAALPEAGGPAGLGDVDLDGELDLAAPQADGSLGLVTEVGVARSQDVGAAPATKFSGDVKSAHASMVDDLDLDGALDVATLADDGAWLTFGKRAPEPPRTLMLLRGRKDNRFGIGTVVEVRAGGVYERRFVQRPAQLFSFPSGEVDPIVRLWWPDGVVQYPLQSTTDEDMEPLVPPVGAPRRLELPVDSRKEVRALVEQKKGPPGSCPFLYAWDGTKYAFVTDVLGTTPLGLPIDEKSFVPPGHDELVRLTAAQLAPVDGEWRVQVTEELREVTYLDRAQLWIVDHPADVELHPEERVTFPPFPPKRIHAMRDIRPLVRAVDQDGVDWSDALARIDDRPAIPFRPIGECFRGIATRSTLELTLPDAAKSAKRVRLLMTGWLQWGDASVNLAAAKNGGIEFLPPVLSVPAGPGAPSAWRDCGPPVGFPAGKTKTMVLDVGDLLNRDDLRLRITTTLELYWDAIRVALDDGDAPFTVTKVEPKSARLSFRGFSKPAPRREDQPLRFEWNRLEENARWDQHAGMLTRYGDVTPLLGEVDDRLVIFSAGDAIDLRFDATAPPPGPGMARTCLLFLDGWAKDGDPNTTFSQTVEPLPFHAMSGYPYGPDEHYPDDELHADYRAQWNTRPGRHLIDSLVAPTMAANR